MATREEAQGARRELTGQQAVIVVGVLILLLLVLWFLFLRGGGTDPEPVAPVTAPEVVDPTPEVTPDVEEPNQPKDGPVETFEVFASKDPFEPLVNPAGTSGAPTGTAPATSTGGDPTGGADDGTGGPGDDGSGGGGGNGGGGSGDGSSNVSGHTVRLIDVYRQNGRMRAQIQVDGTVYTVDVGERFATNFELVDISGECASILYGDDQFSICEGEEILK